MSKLYWVTFRLEQNATWQKRYDALEGVMSDAADGKWWTEPTSFFLFNSELSIGDIATLAKKAIDTDTDVVLIGMPDYKTARVVGSVEDEDLFTIWDWVKKA